MHDALNGEFVAGLNRTVVQARKAGQDWVESIEQFRLLVTAGDKLEPQNVCLLAITLEKFTPEQQRPLRQWRTAERRRLLRVSDIYLDPIRFRTVDEVSVRDYRDSDWVRVTDLGQPAFW